jgi:hypothetical protein
MTLLYDPTPDPEDEERRRRERAGGLWTGPAKDSEERRTASDEIAVLLRRARQKLDDLGGKDCRAAIGLLDHALRLDGKNAEAHLLMADCLLCLDQPERALDHVAEAERHAGDGLRPRVDETRRRCMDAARAEYLEQARVLLRGGDQRRAVAVLSRCQSLIGDDEQVRLIQAYAAVRLDQRGSAADRTDAPWLEAAELERVLRWLTREEISAAQEALHEQRYEAAFRACQAAIRIDNRGGYCALLSATALYQFVQQAGLGPEVVKARLTKAASFARYAERDKSLDHLRRPLAEDIQAALRGIEDHLAQVKQTEPINAVINEYNALVSHYSKPVINRFEAVNFRSSLAPIAAKVNRMLPEFERDSPGGMALADLARKIARLLDQLAR